mgnify:CR=1 FL=1
MDNFSSLLALGSPWILSRYLREGIFEHGSDDTLGGEVPRIFANFREGTSTRHPGKPARNFPLSDLRRFVNNVCVRRTVRRCIVVPAEESREFSSSDSADSDLRVFFFPWFYCGRLYVSRYFGEPERNAALPSNYRHKLSQLFLRSSETEAQKEISRSEMKGSIVEGQRKKGLLRPWNSANSYKSFLSGFLFRWRTIYPTEHRLSFFLSPFPRSDRSFEGSLPLSFLFFLLFFSILAMEESVHLQK